MVETDSRQIFDCWRLDCLRLSSRSRFVNTLAATLATSACLSTSLVVSYVWGAWALAILGPSCPGGFLSIVFRYSTDGRRLRGTKYFPETDVLSFLDSPRFRLTLLPSIPSISSSSSTWLSWPCFPFAVFLSSHRLASPIRLPPRRIRDLEDHEGEQPLPGGVLGPSAVRILLCY